MRTFGDIKTHTLISVQTTDDGEPIIESLIPALTAEGWELPTLVPLVKLQQPSFDSSSQECEPELKWFEDRVERDWKIIPLSIDKARKNMRSALRQQWDSLPAYIKGPYRPEFEAANRLLDEGDDNSAVAMIQYASAKPDFTQDQITVFNNVKQEMIDGISNLPKI